jgi:hypothetical protein
LNYYNLTGPISDGKQYVLNNVYADSSCPIQFSGGSDTLSFSLEAYGTAIFVIADSVIHLELPSLTSVESEGTQRPVSSFRLSQNYPNPFNPSTMFEYDLPVRSPVSLRIYDLLGRLISVLVDETKPAGRFSARWDGINSGGTPVGSGVYFARLQAGSHISVKKLLLIR